MVGRPALWVLPALLTAAAFLGALLCLIIADSFEHSTGIVRDGLSFSLENYADLVREPDNAGAGVRGCSPHDGRQRGAYPGDVAFQNKTVVGQYRSVGHPIARVVTEHLVDKAAARLGLAPEEIGQRNYHHHDAYAATTRTGVPLEALSHETCLARLLTLMDMPALRAEQSAMRERGVHRGIGLITAIGGGTPGMRLSDLAEIGYFEPQVLPPGPQRHLSLSRHLGHD